MGSTYYFLEAPSRESEVLRWFGTLIEAPVITQFDRGYSLYFRDFGPLIDHTDGSPDILRSPVVTFFPPRQVRGVFWTVGEVHFLARSREMPKFDALSRSFGRWMRSFEVVCEQMPKPDRGFGYYLEGTIQNIAPVIYALPSGREALHDGRFFISERDGGTDLTKLCQKLRLRGVVCD